MAWILGLSGFAGVVLGLLAQYGWATWRAARTARRERITAARAWRDDFFYLEDLLSDLAAGRPWRGAYDDLWHPLGTDAGLLSLSPRYPRHGDQWGALGAGRRVAREIVTQWRDGRTPTAAEIERAVHWLELARRELARIDAWAFKPHPLAVELHAEPRE